LAIKPTIGTSSPPGNYLTPKVPEGICLLNNFQQIFMQLIGKNFHLKFQFVVENYYLLDRRKEKEDTPPKDLPKADFGCIIIL